MIDLKYEADLCGNIAQAMKGLQGYDLMALEIIQNADDAGATKLCFDATEKGLIISNDAEFTSCDLKETRCPWERDGDDKGLKRPCNFHAISKMGARSKINDEDQTGRFGIGFVSVYQITDTPTVLSGGSKLKLNPLTGSSELTRIEKTSGTSFELPWASQESDIRDALNASITPDNVVSDLIEKVSEVLQTSLIFLRNLRVVEVRKDGDIQSTVEIKRSGNRLSLNFGPQKREENWLVLSLSADDVIEERELFSRFQKLEELKRRKDVSIAIPVSVGSSRGRLYAYLPTQHYTNMPFHINADFFPHASRQDIVLKGGLHEQAWNEALIETAAKVIEKNFILIRDALTSERLWEIGEATFDKREDEVFSSFWRFFSEAAKTTPSVETIDQKLYLPEQVYKIPDKFEEAERAALRSIGMKALLPTLYPYSSSLNEIGLKIVSLSNTMDLLEDEVGGNATPGNPHLEGIWSAIERLLPDTNSNFFRSTGGGELERLKTIKFLLDTQGKANCLDGLWHVADGVEEKVLDQFDHNSPRVDQRVLKYQKLANLVNEYGLIEFARFLRDSIQADTADKIIGSGDNDIRSLYKLLTSFPKTDDDSEVGAILRETPILRKQHGFVSPKKALLPSGFADPTGYFELVDNALFIGKMDNFAKNILDVRTLSFHDYIDQHLDTVIASELSQDSYRSLLKQIVIKGDEFEKLETYSILSAKPFLRTLSGQFVLPEETFFKTTHLEKILGKNSFDWVDESWMPSGVTGQDFKDILARKLGMPTSIKSVHIAARMDEIQHAETSNEIEKLAAPVIEELINRWPELSKEELESLKDCAFIPALKDDERDIEQLYAPYEVYQASSSKGFSDQVPVIDFPALKKTTPNVKEVLDWLGVKAEPETYYLLEHLKQCMLNSVEPAKATYRLLNERANDEDEADQIEETLKDEAFIWNHEFKKFMRANQMFWSLPPFGNYWWKAGSRMEKLKRLYSLLGVVDRPAIIDYAFLAIEIAARSNVITEDIEVHSLCLGELCKALDGGDEEAKSAIDLLCDKPSLLNLNGEAVWPDDAVWIDSTNLSEPFEDTLKDILVDMPDVNRGVAARFFNYLKVPPISQCAELQLASKPNSSLATHASEKLRERSNLLLWLAPNPEFRTELEEILTNIDIHLTEELWTEVVYHAYDPPSISPKNKTSAFLDMENRILFLSGNKVRWTTASRFIFSQLDKHAVVENSLSMAANSVLSASSYEEAEEDLLASGFAPPKERPQLSLGREFDEGFDDGFDDEDLGADQIQYQNDLDKGDSDQEPDFSFSENMINSDEKDVPVINEAEEDCLVSASSGTDEQDEYKSKTGKPNFSAAEDITEGSRKTTHSASGSSGSSLGLYNSNNISNGTKSRVQKTRTERMLTYVSRGSVGGDNGSLKSTNTTESSMLIDIAAIKAVHKYEQIRGWKTEEQPHGNPGFDIKSFGPNDERRLIEVKGLEGAWTGRGIKLSHTQFRMAEENPEEFWIYVVEKARDSREQKIHAISNPFEKVKEYWFDHNWRDASEELVSAMDLNALVGNRVKHDLWGIGTIEHVEKKGLGTHVRVNFGDLNGTKYIPYNDRLQIVD